MKPNDMQKIKKTGTTMTMKAWNPFGKRLYDEKTPLA